MKLTRLHRGYAYLHLTAKGYCLLTPRTTVGSDNFFNFNQFLTLENANKKNPKFSLLFARLIVSLQDVILNFLQ